MNKTKSKDDSIQGIQTVYLNITEMQYLVIGNNLPVQVRRFTNFSDWDSLNGVDGKPLYDCQIDYENAQGVHYFNFQYVDIIKVEPNGTDVEYVMGSDWRNADNLIVTEEPILDIVKNLFLTSY